MTLPRRQFLHLGCAAALPAVLSFGITKAWAQNYPSRPVRLIVPFAPGGIGDIVARIVGQRLTDRLGQPFVIENRPGAGGNVGAEAVAKAAPDGYTLLLSIVSNAMNTALYERLNFNFLTDIVPVARLTTQPLVVVVNPSFPAKTLPEFITYARNHRGKLNFGSGGNGSSVHVITELFKMMTGTDMVHVSYRGGDPQALTDLIGGTLQVHFSNMPPALPLIAGNKLRPLAVTGATRAEVLPDVPTVGEFVAGYEASGWLGVGAPQNTPTEIIDTLNREINAGLADPAIMARFSSLGVVAAAQSAADFGKFIAADVEKWRKVVSFAGIKPE
jgi:tripartite-type tricarboxylate transporter receptor subunit TctC